MDDQQDTGAPADTGAMGQWAASEQAAFQDIEIGADADAQQADAKERRSLWSGVGRGWNAFLPRRRASSAAAQREHQDLDEAAFSGQLARDIASGAIAPPAGGPLTPEEIRWVETHPWPGHTMKEAVERLRAERAAGNPAPNDGGPA